MKYGARREKEMYFFTKNKPKHENGSRPTRKVRDGFWRASTNMIIQDDNGHKIGRKMLLNYRVDTDKKRNTYWLMYEYTISSNSDKVFIYKQYFVVVGLYIRPNYFHRVIYIYFFFIIL